ncbi:MULTISPECIES: hypothetical protein [unclassified Modestobacter]|uniref:hypothetical protein n=1 Tax=unclassified Modestobacter TaxID=2643866 RepID=UPI0022AA806F|nr:MULTISPECIES: hypothetical protein [unclassified Modestobacter]MCZ2824339.1 hypothetical protein [Modestobacter sp. VKM Ac-2981]MCZ2854133.1 hypothetical protein [Modestobacter sp. VKM Ac-2982]
MTHSIDTPTQSPPGSAQDASTKDVAKDQAKNVGQTAQQAGGQVASTATDQAKEVTQETMRQAQDLLGQGRQQLQEQARNSTAKAGEGLGQVAQQLRGMAEGSGEAPSGPAADLVRQAGEKVDEMASWLQNREPSELIDDVRSFARRRPGVFMLGAALAGVVAGRLTTGVAAAHKDNGSSGGNDRSGRTSPGVEATARRETTDTNYVATPPATGYATEGYAAPAATGTVPPPPYGTPGTAEPTTTGWDDPTGTTREGRL